MTMVYNKTMDYQYTRRLEKIEAEIEKWLPRNAGADWRNSVFPGVREGVGAESFAALTSPGRDLISRGGKRWRPLLMTLVCEALDGGEAALPLAPLVELCHNASLIHDDIEDNSDQRRGRPAVHLLYGVDAAINSGSFLYFLPLSCVAPWAAEMEKKSGFASAAYYQAKVFTLWAEHIKKLHLGQAMDIHWHRNFSLLPALEEYYAMCALKTGCLARFAAALGVSAAGAAGGKTGAPLEEQLGKAAEQLGVGFQILDDIKNLSTGVPGKKRGDDIVEGKKSLPALLFLSRYPEKREMAFRCFAAARAGGAAAPEVEELIYAFESAGVLADAETEAAALVAAARQVFSAAHCAGFPLIEEGRGLLAGLIDLIG